MVDAYLAELWTHLNKKCGWRKADELLKEAKGHLLESAELLQAQGMSHEEAESEAVRRFGEVDEAAKDLAYAHRRPPLWKASRWPVGALLFCWFLRLNGVRTVLLHHSSEPVETILFLCLFWLGVGLLAWACFRAGRWTLPALVCTATVLIGGMALWTVATGVALPGNRGYGIMPRNMAVQMVRDADKEIANAQLVVSELEEGWRWFASTTPPPNLPALYRQPDGYRTPELVAARDHEITAYMNGVKFDGAFADYKTARQMWEGQPSAKGHVGEPIYITQAKDDVTRWQRIKAEGPASLTASFGQRLAHTYRQFEWGWIFLTVLASIGDVVGAGLRALEQAVKTARRRYDLIPR